MTPVTRALIWPESCSTTVVSQSCSCKLGAADLLALEDAGADQRPVMADAGIEQIVEIDGLVRAMEIADAEMHDAGLERGAVVFRTGDLGGQVGEIGRREFHGHLLYPFGRASAFVIPLSPSFTGRG